MPIHTSRPWDLLEQAHVLGAQRSDKRVALRHVRKVLIRLGLGGVEKLENLGHFRACAETLKTIFVV